MKCYKMRHDGVSLWIVTVVNTFLSVSQNPRFTSHNQGYDSYSIITGFCIWMIWMWSDWQACRVVCSSHQASWRVCGDSWLLIVHRKWPLLTPHKSSAVRVFDWEPDAACMASKLLLCEGFENGSIFGLMSALVSPKSKAAPAICGHAFSWDFYSGTLTGF